MAVSAHAPGRRRQGSPVKVLVTAASRHGSTVEVAATIGSVIQAAGHDVEVVAPSEVAGFDGYDAAVIGSAVYVGHWLDPAREILEHHKPALRALRVWLFASGPVGDPPKPAEPPEDGERLVELVHARDLRLFPGAIDRRKLGFAERAVVAAVRIPEGDFRPWGEIEGWAHGIAAALDAESRAG
jgi:menaquinone-dependent protoporphyrinogen oxidase